VSELVFTTSVYSWEWASVGGNCYRLRLVRKVQEVADHYIHQNPQVVCIKVFICCTRGEEEV